MCLTSVVLEHPLVLQLQAKGVMQEGHTFTIEPMINVGTWKDVTWPDGWTSATTDGKRSAQFEHTLLVTADGCDILTKRLPSSPPLWWEKEDSDTADAVTQTLKIG